MTTPPPETYDVVVRAERARVATERIPVERVRVAKRVVTETRTVQVEVRREELVVEPLPVAGGIAAEPAPPGAGPVVEMVLRAEVPQVVSQLVATEVVRVYVDTVTGQQSVPTELRREVVDVQHEELPGR